MCVCVFGGRRAADVVDELGKVGHGLLGGQKVQTLVGVLRERLRGAVESVLGEDQLGPELLRVLPPFERQWQDSEMSRKGSGKAVETQGTRQCRTSARCG